MKKAFIAIFLFSLLFITGCGDAEYPNYQISLTLKRIAKQQEQQNQILKELIRKIEQK